MTLNVERGRIVSIRFAVKNDAGVLLDTTGPEVLSYLHGRGQLVPGLERGLTGCSPGDRVELAVAPKDGFGERVADGCFTIPSEAIPADYPLEPGVVIALTGNGDTVQPFWVTDASSGEVTLDPNHPLAGATLHFSVEVVAVRPATIEERESGIVRRPHHHDTRCGVQQ